MTIDDIIYAKAMKTDCGSNMEEAYGWFCLTKGRKKDI